MQPDLRLRGYLGRALSHELAAIQQYLMQAKLVGLWGMAEMSERICKDVQEELIHAERLMERMLVLGIPSNATLLPPVRTGRNVEEMWQINRLLEIEAIHLYEEASQYCARIRDTETQLLFDEIMREEMGHLGELEGLLSTQRKGRKA
ncbi:MAG: bacterioferritin [Ferrovum sp. 37-45-19]|jgi:bacterioferritin|uniref:ferritin-like domain-containing protein n=1 Tax=Ferrovum sp. JA12 TaxID=1356299 RepID=UPI0007034E52|nr:ferritin-like domain-containing protein [Ferrovum sp. JA12]OYV80619.1 MAG: bacterioferritin [Ferrovum sp. 21-44-67]OYV95170.1 MAG: bacterioferritin [Ferrovum sp. 37-45-19]OZB33803.1 MAG: bacterioferritin [Ferrovum sp. 34-44-207]HQT80667.1 ferritin-like domain-containing protein [Ferrovaceae bacterium]KRH79755.1 bacterioferritin [Ferrovum sp. JA12]